MTLEGLASEVGKQFLTQGVLGSLCIVLAVVVVLMYRRNERERADRLAELTRFIEAREQIFQALSANTLALEGNNKSSEARTRASEQIAREVERLQGSIERSMLQYGFELKTQQQLLEDIRRSDLDALKKLVAEIKNDLTVLQRSRGGPA